MVKEYFLASHFDAPPPPRGPIKLGTILGNLREFHPFNLDHPQPIPASQLLPVETQDSVDIDILDLHSDHHPLIERALGLIGRGLRAPDRRPDGLKIARDASYSSRVSTREVVGRDFALPRNPYVSLAVRLAHRSETVVSSSWRPPDAFIVAFKAVQVRVNHKGEVKMMNYNKKAVMDFEMSYEDPNAPIFPFDGKVIAI
ncbi:hypothetical protein FDENT_767 [Fusarium denticulatum]|uniref:Uncharacterized protein n=1 Tax=Fusarium denticulatum TaxID=48507 RepID=A0A8H5XJZ5_9HYPO|nr:hypothetical protein FDENT_767 [Fusarium denticulatum]